MRVSLGLCLIVLFAFYAEARVIYVKSGADAEKQLEGADWSSATGLHRALALAEPGDQLWLAAGLYSPLVGYDLIPARCASYRLPAGVALFGGFDESEQALSDRRLRDTHQSVLSGDLEGDDVVDPATGVTLNPQSIVGQNANTIVRILGGSRSTMIDGVTLTGARMANFACGSDTALAIVRGSPTIRNCRFIGNYGDYGGAIFLDESPEAVIVNCLFTENEACEAGGAIFAKNSSPLIVNCTFVNHEVDRDGDAISFDHRSSGLIANCILWNERDLGGRAGTIIAQPGQGPLVFGSVIQGLVESGWGDQRAAIPQEGNVEVAPKFIAGTFQLRADSVARGIGSRLLLPTDIGDLDGDLDELETVPFDLAGNVYAPFQWNAPSGCDAGCYQYDQASADSDRDGYLDSFERRMTGSELGLSPPLINQLVQDGDAILLRFSFVGKIRDFTDFAFEAAETLDGPWEDVGGQRVASSLLNEIEVSETWRISGQVDARFFRVKTVPAADQG